MKNPKTYKEFRKIMETSGTKFNIKGHNFAGKPAVFEVGVNDKTQSIWIGRLYSFDQMNVGYVGNTKMDLYTFDMMGGKTTATIKFADVTIVTSPAPLPEDDSREFTVVK